MEAYGSWWQFQLLVKLFALNIVLRKWRARDAESAGYYEAVLAQFKREVAKL